MHTDIGHRCIAARVNNNMVSLRTRLRTGDSVEIITSNTARPNPAWLNFVISGRARSAIRNKLKNIDRSDAVRLGEQLLQRALTALLPQELLLSEDLKQSYLDDLSRKNTSFEDILYDVGMGRLAPVSVAMHIAEIAGRQPESNGVKIAPISVGSSDSGRVQLASCCHPIPGDNIKALLVKDHGLIIHRDTCPNTLKAPPEQQLDANWEGIEQKKPYHTGITVSAKRAHGLLAAMAQAVSGHGADIESVDTLSSAQENSEGFIEFSFSLQVSNLGQLEQIISALYAISQVRKVQRQ